MAKNMHNKPNKFIIDVIPLVPLPLSRQQFYSYLWDTEITPGTLVSIPFFRRAIEGIAIGNRKDFHRFGNIQLKNIYKIIEKGFINEKQIELARFISEYYFSPLGITLKNFIPKRVNERAKSDECKTEKKIRSNKIILTREQMSAVKKITRKNARNNKYLLFGPSSSGKTEIYANAILKMKNENEKSQFLILLPDLTLALQAIEKYSSYFNPKEIAILHSKISKGKFYSEWKKIKSGKAKIIIGSRMAVFSPFKKIGLVIIDEEQDISHKQWDMMPRYDARKVAEKISELHKCPIIFGSAAPRVEDYYRALNSGLQLLKLPRFDFKSETEKINGINKTTKIEIVDMKKERWDKNYSIISKKLKSEIEWNLKNNFQIILFVNRQEESAFSVCADCKNVLKCPSCDRALIYTSEGIYKCLHCAYKTDIFPICQKCKGNRFKQFGIGTGKVEKELKKIFYNANIQRIDSAIIKKSGKQAEIYHNFSQGKIDILIGTQMIAKGWDLPNVGLIGIIDADSLLSIPDFNTDERTIQYLMQVIGRTGRSAGRTGGVAIIQTFFPERIIWKYAAEMDYAGFYEREILDRKTFLYPPFARLIKIIFQDTSKKKVVKETEIISKQLQEIKQSADIISVSNPIDPLLSKVRGKFRKMIIIKITETSGIFPTEFKQMLKKLNKGWIIDTDPISAV